MSLVTESLEHVSQTGDHCLQTKQGDGVLISSSRWIGAFMEVIRSVGLSD